jgi:hypothetical protein
VLHTRRSVQERSFLTRQNEACSTRLAGRNAHRGPVCVHFTSVPPASAAATVAGWAPMYRALLFVCSQHVQLANLVRLRASLERQVGSVAQVLSVCCIVDQLRSSEWRFQIGVQEFWCSIEALLYMCIC